jgi:hypothetical protein
MRRTLLSDMRKAWVCLRADRLGLRLTDASTREMLSGVRTPLPYHRRIAFEDGTSCWFCSQRNSRWFSVIDPVRINSSTAHTRSLAPQRSMLTKSEGQIPALRDTLAEKHVTKILKCFTISAAPYIYICIYIYTHTHTHSLQYRDAGRAKEIKRNGTAVNAACQGNLSACHFGHSCQRFVNPGLLDSSCPSVRPFRVYQPGLHTGRISVKFDTGNFYKCLSRNFCKCLCETSVNVCREISVNVCRETPTLIKIEKKEKMRRTNYLL